MNTRVVDPPRERAVIGQPTTTYSQTQPVAVTSPSRGVTYEFPTFDAHRVPQHVTEAYQPVTVQAEPVAYQSPSRVAQPTYVAAPYQPVMDTQPYTTVPVEVAQPTYAQPTYAQQPAYASPTRVSQPVYTTSPSRTQPVYANGGGNNYGNGGFQVDTTTRIYM